MKVHRIITTIEVENDNSITSAELIRFDIADDIVPLAITNITTTGSANDIKQVYRVIDYLRLGINERLKGIADVINDSINQN